MISFARYMPQTLTYWAPGAADGFGGVAYAAPVLVSCRWQDVAELFRDAQGREVMSAAIVYPAIPLALRGYTALSDHTAFASPRQVAGAREIRQTGFSTDLDNTESLNKLWL